MTLPFLFIYLTEVRHLSSTLVGFVVGWMGALALVMSGPAGALIDKYGARWVLIPMYLVNALGALSYGWVHAPWQAFLSASMVATGGAVLFGGQNTMLSSLTTEEERQRVFGLSFAVLNLGLGLGGLIAGFIADVHRVGSFQLLYVVNAIASAVPVLILLSLPNVGRALVDRKSVEASGGYREVFGNVAFRRFIAYTLLIMVSGYAQIEIGYPAFASLVSGVSTRVVAWGLAANTMTIVVAQLFVLRWMHGRSRSRGLAMVGLLIALAWTILGVSAWAKGAGPAVPIIGVILCASVFACGETLMSPVLPAITNALATDELRGRYNAMGSMVWGVTGIIGPLAAAPLIGHHLGAVWVGLIVAGSLGAAALGLSLRSVLTPEQDGRVGITAEPSFAG
jgi:MFS family permease